MIEVHLFLCATPIVWRLTSPGAATARGFVWLTEALFPHVAVDFGV